MGERFVDTLISITDIHVFADYGDLDASFWANDAFDKFPPVYQIGFRSFQMQKIADQRVQSLGVQHQRHFVNRVLDVALLDHRFFRNAAEHRQFATHVAVERFFGAANQHLRLQPDFAELCHALLRGFCF